MEPMGWWESLIFRVRRFFRELRCRDHEYETNALWPGWSGVGCCKHCGKDIRVHNSLEENHLRKAVLWFAEQMEQVLQDNEYKTGWHGMQDQFLARLIGGELGELYHELTLPRGPDEAIIRECCDVANYAMMLADIARLRQLQELGS